MNNQECVTCNKKVDGCQKCILIFGKTLEEAKLCDFPHCKEHL